MRHGRVDNTQAAIVEALRQVGASVEVISDLGRGAPDLLVGWRRRNLLVECKTGSAKLTTDEREWHAGWAGSVYVVRSPDDALRALGVDVEGV